tara:strand:- start:384 stop:1517 length:1134 start_codon:yes stop_codon:yes gene_type:complete
MAIKKNSNSKSLVVVQLAGGNDALNTIIPYTDSRYFDNRRNVALSQESVIKLNDELGMRPGMDTFKKFWDSGQLAIINGIGYPNPNRSHFRSMDIWYTADNENLGQEGWLGKTIRDLDPYAENVLTGVNFGRSLPRAMYAKDVPVSSVGNLDTYGLFPDMESELDRENTVNAFSRMYGGRGKDLIKDFISQTGVNALIGADVIRSVSGKYSSPIEYSSSAIAQQLQSISKVICADIGTRIYYTTYGGFDTHSGLVDTHSKLWNGLSSAIGDFMDDLQFHDKHEDIMVLIWSEFGRRVADNGAGSDHGAGGVGFLLGSAVDGGFYGEYPSLEPKYLDEGDLKFNNDFRGTYSSILEQWFELDPVSIVGGNYEQFSIVK